MSSWTDELKQEVIAEYKEGNPTPENTMDLVRAIAEARNLTVNGVRVVLAQQGAYIPIEKGKSSGSSGEKSTTPKKSKQDSLDELSELFKSHGVEPDDAIISKLTGKAAEYFITAFKHILEEGDEE